VQVRLLRERFPLLNIQVDGGIGLDNIEIAAEAGEQKMGLWVLL
jgi:pentose-5-phosphate-3-epimerase